MSFVYIVKAYNVGGTHSVVVGHVENSSMSNRLLKSLERVDAQDAIGIEGPVSAKNYPIGLIINEESPDE